MTISLNTEALNSSTNPPLQTLLIKFDVAVATFKNLLNMAVLKSNSHI